MNVSQKDDLVPEKEKMKKLQAEKPKSRAPE